MNLPAHFPVPMMFRDSFQSFLAGFGVPGRDKSVSMQPVLNILGPKDLEALYRSDWLARKIVDVPAFDCTRAWRSWNGDDDQVKKLEKAERELGLQRKLMMGIVKARLYGGAALILGCKDGKFNEELDLDRVGKDDLKFVHVVERWQIAAGPVVRDVTSPWFGEPLFYLRANVATPVTGFWEQELRPVPPVSALGYEPGAMILIHPSRVIRLIGLEYPDIERAPDAWGDSVIQPVYDAIRDNGTVQAAIASLVAEAKLDIIRVPGLSATMSTQAGTANLVERFASANVAKSIINATLLDKDEEWEQKTLTLSGYDKVMAMYLLISAGAADIPATRLFGRSPEGQNATGDSDIRNYYDRLSSDQVVRLTPALSRLDEVLKRSAGIDDEDLDYTWNPLWQHSDAEKADIALKKAQAHQVDVASGLIPASALSKARINQLIADDTYPGLQQAMEEAEEEGDTFLNPKLPEPQNPPPLLPGQPADHPNQSPKPLPPPVMGGGRPGGGAGGRSGGGGGGSSPARRKPNGGGSPGRGGAGNRPAGRTGDAAALFSLPQDMSQNGFALGEQFDRDPGADSPPSKVVVDTGPVGNPLFQSLLSPLFKTLVENGGRLNTYSNGVAGTTPRPFHKGDNLFQIVGDYDPDEPRVPKGQHGGGEWTTGGQGGNASALYNKLKESGGFSFNVVGENSLKPGDKVFMVSPYKDREKVLESGFTPNDLAQYIVDNHDLLQKDGHYFGGWLDPESKKVFLDVSVGVTDAREAAALCRKHDQLAYFDMENMDTVAVPKSVTMEELAKKLGRTPTVNEWREANGKEPIKKTGRKTRKSKEASDDSDPFDGGGFSHGPPEVFTKNTVVADSLNGIPFQKWTPPENWAGVDGQTDLGEPSVSCPKGKELKSGCVVREPDGRVWLVKPANGYGGYNHTFPRGGLERGLSLQANAIKETWEESGLKVRITGFRTDFESDISVTRYYDAVRVGGTPTDFGWESEAVALVPVSELPHFLNRYGDRHVASTIADAGFNPDEPRDPKGSPTAGQWTASAAAIGEVLHPDLVNVGGDEWNRKTAERLEREYQRAKPSLGALYERLVGKSHDVPDPEEDTPYTPESWDEVPSDTQDEIKDSWLDHTLSEFLESEENSWYESGDKEDTQKSNVQFEYEKAQKDKADAPEWFNDAVQGVMDTREENEEKPIPYSIPQLFRALSIDYETGYGGDHDPDLSWDDDKLKEPSNAPPPEQLSLPGVEMPDLATHLTQEMRDQLENEVILAFKKEADDKDVEPPDYLSEQAKEYQNDYWDHSMDDADKFKWGKDNTNLLDEPEESEGQSVVLHAPTKFDPLEQFGSEHDYKATQNLMHALFADRAVDLLMERKLFDDAREARSYVKRTDASLWSGWKGSSTSDQGLQIQKSVADELGARERAKLKDRAVSDPKVNALTRAKWEVTQFILEKAGITRIQLFRAVGMHDTDWSKLKYKTWTDEDGEIGKQVLDVKVERNGAASTSTDRGICNNWGGDSTRLVLRAEVPRTAVLSVPAYGQNIHSEHEVVVTGTAWAHWDAWKGRAPSFKDMPIEKAASATPDLDIPPPVNKHPEIIEWASGEAAWYKAQGESEDTGYYHGLSESGEAYQVGLTKTSTSFTLYPKSKFVITQSNMNPKLDVDVPEVIVWKKKPEGTA